MGKARIVPAAFRGARSAATLRPPPSLEPVGKAGEPANRDKLSISFNGIRVAHKGARDPSYNETEVSQAMKAQVISLKVGIGLGKGKDRVLTCDLTKEYVAINGDYRS